MSPAIEYEVVLDVDAGDTEDFDRWLADHIAEMTALPGFLGAEVLVPDEHAATRRRVRYRLRDREALETYLAEHAPRMRQATAERFGERVRSERQVGEVRDTLVAQDAAAVCRNCGGRLTGQYCAACGQRSGVRLITLWEFFRDLIGDLFELDSRLWRTLRPLLFRPGKLTAEYLSGRRVAYLPPLRLYIGLSLIFFLIASVGGDDTGFVVGTDADGNPANLQLDMPEEDREALRQALGEGDADSSEDTGLNIDSPEDCALNIRLDADSAWPAWIDREDLQARLITTCEKIVADHGASLGRALLGNIPAMMFFFLPMMALLMKPLYLFGRRYYVEHLLFLVHYHAFVFFLLIVIVISGFVSSLIPGMGFLGGALIAIAFIYVPIYLYKAMRRVYGQGHVLTFLKYFVLGIDYAICLLLSFIGTFIYTALTL